MGRFIKPEVINEIVRLFNQGMEVKKISEALKVSRMFCVKKLRELGYDTSANYRPVKNTLTTVLAKLKYNPKNGCHEWQGGVNNKGYGSIRINGKLQFVHRFMYSTYNGNIGKMHVLHKCDNPLCCNPNHLFLGTHVDNMKDMALKGRGGVQRVMVEDVKNIRRLRLKGYSVTSIASKYEIGLTTVKNILKGRTFSWVD